MTDLDLLKDFREDTPAPTPEALTAARQHLLTPLPSARTTRSARPASRRPARRLPQARRGSGHALSFGVRGCSWPARWRSSWQVASWSRTW